MKTKVHPDDSGDEKKKNEASAGVASPPIDSKHPSLRRATTASIIQYPMFLIPATKLFSLYGRGENAQSSVLEAHQVLKARGDLVRWEDVRDSGQNACIVFVSHEWVSWGHASMCPSRDHEPAQKKT